MDTSFKIATRADTDLLVRFMLELYEHDQLPFDEPAARRALEKILHDHALGRVWLIQDGDQAIGYAVLTLGYSLEYHGRDAFIDEIYISASHRGKDIGAQAIQFVEEACRALEVQALHLEVERANTQAQAFYHKAGFQDHERYLLTKWIAQPKSSSSGV
jgi:ribosomal protein S18 acetylase RimI-like enzyme